MQIEILKAEEKDIEEIFKAEKICFGDDSWSESMIKDAICGKFSDVTVAKSNDKICGYLVTTILGGDEINIDNIAVLPDMRRNHIAESLINNLLENLNCEIKKLTLEVRENNIAAIKLYEKLGFYKTGLRKNYYKNPVENAILMDKETE